MELKPRDVQELVEQQVRKWQLEEEEAARTTDRRREPVITVSREYGARGAMLARALANKLELELWDQELVHAIAEETGLSASMLRSIDEHKRGQLEDMIDGIIFGVEFTQSEYLKRLMRVIHTIAHHGSAVLVGRGANFILPERAALRVRVVCPIEQRVKWLAESQKLDERAARRKIEHVDREREAFNRQHFRRSVSDPSAYDVVINVGSFTLDRAADLVIAAYRIKFGG